MSFGPLKVFSVGLGAAGTFSSAFTFPNGTLKAFLEVPTMSTAADFYLNGSTDGTNYRRVMSEVAITTTVQLNTFTIASAATNKLVPIPIAAPFMRVECTTAPVSACTFNIIFHY